MNREILTYVEGTAGFHHGTRISPDYPWSDQILTEAARVLRALHDATVDFVLSPDASWQVVYPDRATNALKKNGMLR
jgi:hypothetical protein